MSFGWFLVTFPFFAITFIFLEIYIVQKILANEEHAKVKPKLEFVRNLYARLEPSHKNKEFLSLLLGILVYCYMVYVASDN